MISLISIRLGSRGRSAGRHVNGLRDNLEIELGEDVSLLKRLGNGAHSQGRGEKNGGAHLEMTSKRAGMYLLC